MSGVVFLVSGCLLTRCVQVVERVNQAWCEHGSFWCCQTIFRPRGHQRSFWFVAHLSRTAFHSTLLAAIPVRLHGTFMHKALQIIFWGINQIEDVFLKV